MQNEKPTLEQIHKKLDDWRNSRTKKGRIPDNLWDEILKLLDNYPIGQICHLLRISSSQIKNKQKEQKAEFKDTKSSEQFAEITLSEPTNFIPTVIAPSRIEIKRTDGASLIIEQLNEEAISRLLTKFIGKL